jgi:hypothetical protein
MKEPLSTIDRILSSEPPVEPSARFTQSVMEAVRTQSTDSAFTFPWKRFLLGCAGAALAGAFVAFAVLLRPFPIGSATAVTLLSAALALLVSFASIRLSETLVT